MTTSQNGWTVDTSGARQDRGPLVRDVTVPNGVLAGDVAVVFRWLAREYESRVERLVKGTCWGWYVKKIEGSSSISNHASGTAVDFNADAHPMGQDPASSFSAKKIAACRAIVDEAGGVLRWGGDYSGRKDGMHWEIHASAAKVKQFADKIREGDDMPLSDEDIDRIATAAAAKVWGYQLTNPAGGGTVSAGTMLRYSDARELQTRADVEADVNAARDQIIAEVTAHDDPPPAG